VLKPNSSTGNREEEEERGDGRGRGRGGGERRRRKREDKRYADDSHRADQDKRKREHCLLVLIRFSKEGREGKGRREEKKKGRREEGKGREMKGKEGSP